MRSEVKGNCNRAGKTIAIVIVSFFGLVFSILISIPVVNNFTALNVEKILLKAPLPDDTELCDSLHIAGKITGNGNGMQFFGAMLIKSGLPIEALDKYYSEYREGGFDYLVEPQTSAEISTSIADHGGIVFSHLEKAENFDGFYIVYSWGRSNYFLSDWDLRGH